MKGATLEAEVPYVWNGTKRKGKLIPDALFAIDYGGKFRAFALEADRATERLDSEIDRNKSFRRNLLQYQQFIGKGLYKASYGLTGGLVVLFVTTSGSRERSFLRMVDQHLPGCTYLCFQQAPEFGSIYKPPEFQEHFAEEAWRRASGADPLDIMKP
tara:strand:- start:149 stop:619 length:471 start_codon:yes stop_codon:yes gene_type:complete